MNLNLTRENGKLLTPIAAGALSLALLLQTCAHTHARKFAHTEDGAGFKLPELSRDWKPVESKSADLAYINKDGTTAISANITCGDIGGDEISLDDLARFVLYGVDETKTLEKSAVVLDGREFLFKKIQAKQLGEPLLMALYLTRAENCIYDLQFVAEENDFDAAFPQFKQFAEGFKFTEKHQIKRK